jgi:hypothetical protein
MRVHAIALLAAGFVAGCTSLEPRLPPPPTTAEIVQMAKDGMTADGIIARIDAARGVYPLPASESARLRAEGVPDRVIDSMQRTYVDAVWLDGYLRARDAYFVYGSPSYPYPYGGPFPYWGWRRP